MASLDRSFVLLRFSFGKAPVKGRQRALNTYRYKVGQLAIRFADGEYRRIKEELEKGVANDVRRELVNMASLYRRHIIGANASTNKPAGVLRNVVGDVERLPLASVLPAWAPRSAEEYLERKIRNGGTAAWFDTRGWRKRSQAGLLFRESRADTWETMFGPISVRFNRDNAAPNPATIFNTGNHVNVQIGTLRVYALGKITPNMLPGLAGGYVGMASDSGNPGLMGLVKNYDRALWGRLSRRSAGTKRYRPTLEPFLGFFLSRAIPQAVKSRIQRSTFGRITRSAMPR